MIRKTLTILSLVGLVLSLGLWVVSYLRLVYQAEAVRVELNGGRVLVYRLDGSRSLVPILRAHGFSTFKTGWKPVHFVLTSGSTAAEYWFIPLWMPAVLFASCFLPMYRPLRRYRCRKRMKLGLCVKCAYDLRGSKDRCPECGTGFEDKVKQP